MIALASLTLVFSAILAPSISAAWPPATADVVLGQVDFTHNAYNRAKLDSLSFPSSIAIDLAGRLYVADGWNSRVLGWRSETSFVNGAAADLVIGQRDFQSGGCNQGTRPDDLSGVGPDSLCFEFGPAFIPEPTLAGVAVDSSGNLYVTDPGNNRLLVYTAPFSSCGTFPCVGPAASFVFGQPDFTSTRCNQGTFDTSASKLCGPVGVALDSKDNLYVSDAGNYRVLEYNTPLNPGSGEPGAGDAVADNLFGPFTGSFSDSGSCDSSFFCGNGGVTLDRLGNLYVADGSDYVVLEFNTPLDPNSGEPGAGDNQPDGLLGDNSSSVGCGVFGGNPASNTLCGPGGVAVDYNGNVYVADTWNNRVLEYSTPFASGSGHAVADRVFGQPDFTSASCPTSPPQVRLPARYTSANSLCYPLGVSVDPQGNLFVADEGSHRVVVYNTPLDPGSGGPGAGDTTADRVLGQSDFDHKEINRVDAFSLSVPQGEVVDSAGHLYLADTGRVLGWKSPANLSNGQPADLVIGQPDFTSVGCDSQSTLCAPQGLALDSAGNLFVSDPFVNRIVEFDAPFSACKSFPCVAGKPRLVVGSPVPVYYPCDIRQKPTRANLCGVHGIAVDLKGNLYAADYAYSRVLEFDHPLRKSRKKHPLPDRVLGAPNFRTYGCTGSDMRKKTCKPEGIAVDSAGNLYVATGQMVEEFLSPLKRTSQAGSGDKIADVEVGLPDFNSSFIEPCGVTGGTPDAFGFCGSSAIALDPAGNLYVSDWGNNRVLEFDAPLHNGAPASRVFGQANFTTGACNAGVAAGDVVGLGPDSLCFAGFGWDTGLEVDNDSNLFISDGANNRVLLFHNPLRPVDPQKKSHGVPADYVPSSVDK